jgi:coenzyme F420 hydrogenase subunit beta
VREIDKLQRVIRSGLCNRCGTCVGLSDGMIQFRDRTGKYLPEIITEPDDDLSKRLWHACAGKEFDYKYYRHFVFPDENHFHTYIGSYREINIGYCLDEEIRRLAASGGILSAILIWLLENKKIDGAVVLGMSEEEPWSNKPYIAKSRREILNAAQSKYTISSVNEILPQINSFNGTLAYVGLPGQVHSVRKLQEKKDPTVRNIKYIFGPFYGNIMHFSSIISFLRSNGEKDYKNIRSLQFRYGEWPGTMRIEMQSGKVLELPKFHANYLIPFHILKNSLLCTDLTNEFTDISGGDAWASVYEEKGKGFSQVISRSFAGQKILEEMVSDGLIHLQTLNEDEAITMHSHGYDLKKRGAFIRMKFRKILGMEVPNYGYQVSGFSFSRYIMEIVINILFLIAGTKIVHRLVEQISPKRIGNFFEKTRKSWKKNTYKIKRKGL